MSFYEAAPTDELFRRCGVPSDMTSCISFIGKPPDRTELGSLPNRGRGEPSDVTYRKQFVHFDLAWMSSTGQLFWVFLPNDI